MAGGKARKSGFLELRQLFGRSRRRRQCRPPKPLPLAIGLTVAFVCVSRKRKARALKTRDGCYILLDPRIARRIQTAASPCDARRRR